MHTSRRCKSGSIFVTTATELFGYITDIKLPTRSQGILPLAAGGFEVAGPEIGTFFLAKLASNFACREIRGIDNPQDVDAAAYQPFIPSNGCLV